MSERELVGRFDLVMAGLFACLSDLAELRGDHWLRWFMLVGVLWMVVVGTARFVGGKGKAAE